jgi:hypothetical protein
MRLPLLSFFTALLLSIAARSEMVFFAFDDHSIPWRDNVKLTMVQAQKHPANPVLEHGPEGAPDHGHAVMYGSVLRIGGKFRMWYLGMIQTRTEHGQAPGFWRPMCYAESDDGVHWTKPNLGLVELNGSKQNNICLVQSEVPSLALVDDFLTVIHEPEEPDPARRYKCAYIAHPPFEDVRGGRSAIGPDEKRWGAMICATSADGLTWHVVGDRPMNAGGERYEVSGLYHFGGFYYATGQIISPWTAKLDGGTVGRVMRAYRSPDFTHWNSIPALAFARPGQLLAEPLKGQQTHMGAGMWNRGNVMLGLYGQWQDAPQPPPKGAKSHLLGTHIDLGFILSNDGIHWREPVPDFKTVARGPEGSWDSIALLQAHAFANVGEQTYLWYSHWDCDGEFRHQDIGLATLRRDGFGYVETRVPGAPAAFQTTGFTAGPKTAISINLDGVTPEQPVTVEFLDGSDRPIPGFAATLKAGGVQVPVVWHGGASLPGAQPVALRVKLPIGSQAHVYALYVNP